MRLKIIIGLVASLFVLSGCTEKTSFKAGDIKDDYCGAYMNFQYCKCAFHNEYCDAIGMKKGDANKYVNEQYDKWVESEFVNFKEDCRINNGIMKDKSCVQCAEGEVAENNVCVIKAVAEQNEWNDAVDEAADEVKQDGVCKYDSDCDPICEGDVMWKMGCNARTNACEKTFDTDCRADIESFGELSIPKVCDAGACIRDESGIQAIKDDLIREQKLWSDTVKQINSTRANINTAMLEANKNCINGIADMTNVAIMEFATRIASVLAGGIPDVAAMSATAAEKAGGLAGEHIKNLAGAAGDYVGEALNRLYNYQSGEPAETEKKLAPHEYIKLNCDLYQYFKGVLAESDSELDTALKEAEAANAKLQALP